MKNLMLVMLAALVCGCGNLNHDKAKAIAEALIQKENSQDIEGTSQYYTYDFNNAQPVEVRKDQLKQLHDAFGDLTGTELKSIKDTTDPNDLKCVDLIYRVKHARLNSIEEFVIINDEGDYKVELHSINKE